MIKLLPIIILAVIANTVMVVAFIFLRSDIPEEVMTDLQVKVIYGTFLVTTVCGIGFALLKRKVLFKGTLKFLTLLSLLFCTPFGAMIVLTILFGVSRIFHLHL
jgi:hypothetical protein